MLKPVGSGTAVTPFSPPSTPAPAGKGTPWMPPRGRDGGAPPPPPAPGLERARGPAFLFSGRLTDGHGGDDLVVLDVDPSAGAGGGGRGLEPGIAAATRTDFEGPARRIDGVER